jgi:hypothetical protein
VNGCYAAEGKGKTAVRQIECVLVVTAMTEETKERFSSSSIVR